MLYTFSEQRGLRRGQSHTTVRKLILWMTPRKDAPMLWVLSMTKKYKDFSSHWNFSVSDTEARISFSQVPVGPSTLGVWKHHSKLGFPGGSVVKNPKNNAYQCRRCWFDHCVGKIPRRRKRQPVLAWEILWTEETGGRQSMRSQKQVWTSPSR